MPHDLGEADKAAATHGVEPQQRSVRRRLATSAGPSHETSPADNEARGKQRFMLRLARSQLCNVVTSRHEVKP